MTLTKRVVCAGLAALVALPLLAACSRNKVRAGEARVDPNGSVEVMKPGGSWKAVKETKIVKNGDKVRVLSGDAEITLPSAKLGLRSGSEVMLAQSPDLLRGDLLVVPDSRAPLTVKSAGTDYAVVGAARIARSFAVTAASYYGLISVRSAGFSLGVPALRQATVAALGSDLPQAAVPLRYSDKDPWDRRFLAEAIDLGNVLQARSEAGTNQFRGQGSSVGFYRILFPELAGVGDFDRSLIDVARPAGENIVGAAIALKGRQGGFAQRWQRIFSFRSEGATWGLVAFDQQVHKVPDLVRRIDDAFGGAGLPGSPGRLAFSTTTTAGPGPSPTTATTRPPTSTTQTTQGTQPTPPTTTTILPNPPDTGLLPIDNTGNETVETVNDLVGGLITVGR